MSVLAEQGWQGFGGVSTDQEVLNVCIEQSHLPSWLD
jgi:hypothetical protein